MQKWQTTIPFSSKSSDRTRCAARILLPMDQVVFAVIFLGKVRKNWIIHNSLDSQILKLQTFFHRQIRAVDENMMNGVIFTIAPVAHRVVILPYSMSVVFEKKRMASTKLGV